MPEPLTPKSVAYAQRNASRMSLPELLVGWIRELATDWQRLYDENARLNQCMDTHVRSIQFLDEHNAELHAENSAMRAELDKLKSFSPNPLARFREFAAMLGGEEAAGERLLFHIGIMNNKLEQAEQENTTLRQQVAGLAERVAAQSELLGRRAESSWIKRGEQTLEKNQIVLACSDEAMWMVEWDGKFFNLISTDSWFNSDEVTHWRPLPDFPTGVSKQGVDE